MRVDCVKTCIPSWILLGLAFAANVRAENEVKPAVDQRDIDSPHKMVIYNGPNRTVHYFAGNASPGEVSSLRELERSENDLAYADGLQALRRQYVELERYLATNRAVVQDRLYGISTDYNSGSYLNGSNGVGRSGYPFFGGGVGAYGFPGDSYGISSSNRISQSLANGVGSEGPIKEALARTIATQATPEYTAAAARSYDTALVRAGESDRLRTVAGLSKRERGGVANVGFEQPTKAVLTLKGGEKVEGKMLREDADWFVIETATEELSVRKSDVTRVSKPKAAKSQEK